MHRQRRLRINLIRPARAQKVTDDGNVRIENLRSCRRSAIDGQLPAGPAGALRAWRHLGRLRWSGCGGRSLRRGRRLRLILKSCELPFERLKTLIIVGLQSIDLGPQRVKLCNSRSLGETL